MSEVNNIIVAFEGAIDLIKGELNKEQIDWQKVKEIICGIAKTLDVVCDSLPIGIIKNVLCGIAGLLNLICSSIPLE